MRERDHDTGIAVSVDMECCDSVGERLCESESVRDDMTTRYLRV